MYAREWLETIARAVKETGGFYGFKVDGDDYVILRREELHKDDVQLSLEGAGREKERAIEREITRANELLESYRLQREQRKEDGNGLDFDDNPSGLPVERDDLDGGVMRVRFEPLRGDLPPELQE